ncbi:hypothetical protein HMY34_06070 [Thiothrix subterranea]|uniref:hypothetical protein n=1 Tax=Thiothrix subterranea TaxID=2735563 RepID=UPI00192AD085|nr:hypothetical protein [Thiothrix subterranea]QQZ28354.1 hypothetical protein HMY34_06070 [Thiothrix subterranea]
MTELVVENLRLKELILVVNKNKPFFDEFVAFVKRHKYENVLAFVSESNEIKMNEVLNDYFSNEFKNCLYDGIARPYDQSKSKWFFITWLLRDAPQQRLQPIVSSLKEGSTTQKRIFIINKIMQFVAPLMPEKEQWEWHAIAEVMLQRLEGSRRALKGGLFEAIVRDQLAKLFKSQNLKLQVTNQEVILNDETYDIEIIGKNGKILMPVKTRETMGGGHAHLFTRDIHKSISVAHKNGLNCIPIVIAESWSGNLDGLSCDNYIYIPVNPNQVEKINPLLELKLQELVMVFSSIQ